MTASEVDLTVYPDDCDAYGHLNQAAYLRLFERARWDVLARGPGMDLFTRTGSWPALRRVVVEFHASTFPGDVLRFNQTLVHRGRTSFTLRQSASRLRDGTVVATGEFVFVCVDPQGKSMAIPEALDAFLAARPEEALRSGSRVTVNGVSLALEDQGEGPPILFIHGYPLDKSLWQDQVKNLSPWRRIAPDLRGLGDSDAPDLGYSMATYAADLAALLDALGVGQVVLCGLSMGGYVAFELLRSHRERVLGLVLISTRAEADSAEGRKARDQAAGVARERGAGAIAESMLPKMLSPGSQQDPDLVSRLRNTMARAPVPGIVGALTAMRERPDSTGLLGSLSGLPTLVIAGESDQLIPLADVTRMHDAIPGSVLKVIPGAGHVSPLEQPAAVTAALREFLVSLPR